MNTTFSGWREGARHYLPWYAIALAITVLFFPFGYGWASLPLWILALAVTLFFRDFSRELVICEDTLFSPADGTVVAIEDRTESPYYEGPTRYVAIFMSVFNVHVNRAPCNCRVRDIQYAPGAYKNAKSELASRVNESNALWLDTDFGPVTIRQISGAVARRIVCKTAAGQQLTQGEKFGMIKFGSRVELYLPPEMEVRVQIGDKPRAGLTKIATAP